jgi:hypothetical protein
MRAPFGSAIGARGAVGRCRTSVLGQGCPLVTTLFRAIYSLNGSFNVEHFESPGETKKPPAIDRRRGNRTGYFPMRYVRSPASFLADSILMRRFFPAVEMNPLTLCACHPVSSMESTSKRTWGEG